MAAVRKSSLFPPDPHYIPGYEGFVPQYSYQFGETFGKTTFRLLTDPSIRKSPHSLLAPLPKLRFIEDFTGTKHEVPDYIPVHPADLSPREAAAGASPPGLAPEPSAPAPCQGPSGERRAQTRAGPADTARPRELRPSHPGLRLAYEYEQEIPARPSTAPRAAEEREGRLPDIPAAGARRGAEPPCPPDPAYVQGWSFPSIPEIKQPVKIESATLPAVTEWVDAESYDRFPRLDVPYAIQQKVTSGYTGYIPRYTWVTGVNYIQGVKDAMSEFDRNQFLLQNPVCEFGKRLPQSYWPNNRIYTSAGLIPFYTGFVPKISTLSAWGLASTSLHSRQELSCSFQAPTSKPELPLQPAELLGSPALRHSYALTFGNSTRKAYQKEQRRQACALRKKTLMMPVQHLE